MWIDHISGEMERTHHLHRAYIGAGSNLRAEEAVSAIERASEALAALGLVRPSSTYRTDGVGVKSAGMVYHNAVFEFDTQLDADSLNAALKQYEEDNGRDRSTPVITIDLDLVVYDGEVLRPADFSHSYFLTGYRQLGGAQ